MKKILIGLFVLASVSAFANDGINVYGKVGVDTFSKFTAVNLLDDAMKSPTKGKLGVNFAVEVTKDITPNFELGAGLAYTYRKSSKMNETLVDEDNHKYNFDSDVPRYKSIPLYLTGKYNFDIDSAVRPYVKADLGYSFNRDINGTITATDMTTKETKSVSEKIKVKNGLYAAVGVGAEYNNFIADLSYVHTNAKLKWETGETDKYNNGTVRLSVGYKFSF